MSGSVILQRQDNGQRLALDAVPSWSHARTWRPTESPIEAEAGRVGLTITDQVQRMPDQVTLDVTMTQSPLTPDGLGVGAQRMEAFIAWINNAQGQLLTLFLPDRPTVRDLVIVTFPEEGDLYQHLRARLSLASVTIVETGTANIPAQRRVKPAARAGLAPTEDKGQAPTKPVEERKASTLLDGLREARRLLGGG